MFAYSSYFKSLLSKKVKTIKISQKRYVIKNVSLLDQSYIGQVDPCRPLTSEPKSESVCVYSLSVSLFVCVSSIKELENIAELHNTKKLETNRTFIATWTKNDSLNYQYLLKYLIRLSI